MPSIVRYPQFIISAGGVSLTPLQFSVSLTNRNAQSTFNAVLALDAPGNPGASFWSNTAPMPVTITGMGGTLFSGNADKVGIDFLDRVVHLGGRDNSAKLHDISVVQNFKNQTPQQIIQQLAGQAGLTVQFNVQSSGMAGQQYKDDYNLITDYDNAWSVITALARKLGAVVSVRGNTLYVSPANSNAGGGSFTVTYQPPTPESPEQANVLGFRVERDLHLAKTVNVTANSWQYKQAQKVTATATVSGVGGNIQMQLHEPDQTQQQLQTLAKGHGNETVARELEVTVRAPGDASITAQGTLTVQGTQSRWDGQYAISDVRHYFSYRDGYTMDITARSSNGRQAQ